MNSALTLSPAKSRASLWRRCWLLAMLLTCLLAGAATPAWAQSAAADSAAAKNGAVNSVAGLAAPAHPAAAPGAADKGGNRYMLQLFSGLLVVLVSIVVLAIVAKRFNRWQPAGAGNLKILGGMSMGGREKVVLVQAGNERILLGVAPGRVNCLHVLAGGCANDAGAHADCTHDLGHDRGAHDAIGESAGLASTDGEAPTFAQKLAASLLHKHQTGGEN